MLVLILLSRVTADGSYLTDVLPGIVVMGIGLGFTFVPLTLIGTTTSRSATPGSHPASSTRHSRWVARSAWRSSPPLAANRTADRLSAALRPAAVAARVSGYHVAFLAAAIMLAIGAALLVFGLRKRHMREVERELANSGAPSRSRPDAAMADRSWLGRSGDPHAARMPSAAMRGR